MAEWDQKITDRFKHQLAGVNDKDLRFFRIEEYLRIVKRVEEFSATCRECKQFHPDIEQQAKTIGQAVKHTGRDRAAYDRHLDKLARHMKKGHGFYPPYYFTYSLSFFYALAAIGLAFPISFLFPAIDPWFFVVTAFVLGLAIGQLQGARKDSKVRATKKLL